MSQDKLLTELTELTSVQPSDLLYVVDVSDTSDSVDGSSRRVQASNLRAWATTAAETAAAVTPVSYQYDPGNVFRYGAVADSSSGVQGTDNTIAFQRAVDSGHAVYVPEGYYAIEGTINIFNTAITGNTGIHFEMAGGVRLERYGSSVAPIIHISGVGHKLEGNGANLAARVLSASRSGGYTKGLLLLGPDPAATTNAAASVLRTSNNWISDLRIIGKTSETAWDGSIGMRLESAGRRRGSFVTPTRFPCYYNMIRGVYVTQLDYGFFLSTDSNANTFSQCETTEFGHACLWINGYGNVFSNFIAETPTAQDATERAVVQFGRKDFGPETNFELTDEDATQYSITAISKNTTTTLTIGTHTLEVGDFPRITGVVDSGAGDLAALLNTGHFEVTAIAATTITISQDTSGAAATWASGGTVYKNPYPIYSAYANRVEGYTEVQFDADTKKVRTALFEDPLTVFSTIASDTNRHRNTIRMVGTQSGGTSKDGFSTEASVLKNRVDTTSSGFAEYTGLFRAGNLRVERLDDASGSGYGTKYHQNYAGRMADMLDATAYDIITIDNVGVTSASVLIKLSFCYKEQANADHEAGEISWLCPVTASTAQTPIKIKDFQANYNGSQPYLTFSVANSAGTTANTGKFILRVTQEATGTGNGFLTWFVELLHSNVQDNGLDWAADVSIQNGGLPDSGA